MPPAATRPPIAILAAGGEKCGAHAFRRRREPKDRPRLRKYRERNPLGDRVRRIIRHRHLVGIGAEVIERIDHDGRLGAEPDGAEQVLLQIRTDRKDRIEQQQQSPAAGEIFDKQIGLARREGGARADIGDDRAVGRDGAF